MSRSTPLHKTLIADHDLYIDYFQQDLLEIAAPGVENASTLRPQRQWYHTRMHQQRGAQAMKGFLFVSEAQNYRLSNSPLQNRYHSPRSSPLFQPAQILLLGKKTSFFPVKIYRRILQGLNHTLCNPRNFNPSYAQCGMEIQPTHEAEQPKALLQNWLALVISWALYSYKSSDVVFFFPFLSQDRAFPPANWLWCRTCNGGLNHDIETIASSRFSNSMGAWIRGLSLWTQNFRKGSTSDPLWSPRSSRYLRWINKQLVHSKPTLS